MVTSRKPLNAPDPQPDFDTIKELKKAQSLVNSGVGTCHETLPSSERIRKTETNLEPLKRELYQRNCCYDR